MTVIEIYLTIGFVYSLYLLFEAFTSSRPNNREYWIGILLIGTLFWPIDIIVGNIGLVHKKPKLKLK